MQNYFYPFKKNRKIKPRNGILNAAIIKKVYAALVAHVYKQKSFAIASSLFCGMIIFFGIYTPNMDNTRLFIWASFFVIIAMIRTIILLAFKREKSLENNINLWRNFYIFGSLLGGLSWGFAGIILFTHVTPIQQMLLIMMLAGISAGSVSLSSAIPNAAIAFLICSVLPFIINIALLGNHTYLLFDAALSLYLIYSIVLSIKASHLNFNSIILQFENDILVGDLSSAKEQLEITNKKLEVAATHDPLTRIANRRLFMLNLANAIQRAQQNKSMLALLFIDIDNFKQVNDLNGHHAGDHVLVVTVERLENLLETDKDLARLGGDELTLIVENAKSIDHIAELASKICKITSQPINVHNVDINVTVSIGISIYPNDSDNINSLISNSDNCMYYAKKHGRNRYHFNNENIKASSNS